MLKVKSKILLVVLLALVLISSCCFATDDLLVSTDDGEEPTVISGTPDLEDISVIAENSDADSELVPENYEDLYANWTNSDLYTINSKVEVSNVVDGNAFIIGEEVTISGEIGGDLFVIANKLNIEGGYVYSGLFAIANEININGVVYDLYALCNNLNLGSNGFVYRDMRLSASNINLEGKVRRNAYLSCNNLNFGENAETVFYGDLTYSSSSEFSIPDNAVVGEITFNEITINKEEPVAPSIGNIILTKVLSLLKNLLLTFVIVVMLLWLTPKFVDRISNMKVGKSFACLGIGVATPIAFVIAGIILVLLQIGSTVFVTASLLLALLFIIADAVACLFFGKLFAKLLKLEGNVKLVLMTLASSLVLWLISLIPVVGLIVGLLVGFFGLGTIIVNVVCKKEKANTEVKE